jgi:hypothetical protein
MLENKIKKTILKKAKKTRLAYQTWIMITQCKVNQNKLLIPLLN